MYCRPTPTVKLPLFLCPESSTIRVNPLDILGKAALIHHLQTTFIHYFSLLHYTMLLLKFAQNHFVKRELIPPTVKLCVQNVYKYGAAIEIGLLFLLVD